jgi:predicted dehydrogenase
MSTLRTILVGAGTMGRNWARNIVDCDGIELAGWVDIMPDRAEKAAEELGIGVPHIGGDLAEALRDVKPDFVVDVTTPDSHGPVTIESLRAGVPVLGEKPMANSLATARRMVAASEKSGKLYMVSQSRRYNPRLAALRGLIGGSLENLAILTSDFFMDSHFGGFRDQMPSPLLLDMAIHTFDAARYLSGRDAVSVYCEEFNPPWSWFRGAACAEALFEMTGGVRYSYRGSWCAQGAHTSWEAQWRAVGGNGSATWDGTGTPLLDRVVETGSFQSKTERTEATFEKDQPAGIAASLREFIAALKSGKTPMGECHDNFKSLAMVFAAVESAAAGRRVPVESA